MSCKLFLLHHSNNIIDLYFDTSKFIIQKMEISFKIPIRYY